MNPQTNIDPSNFSNEILPLENTDDFRSSWILILATLVVNILVIFIIELFQISRSGFNTLNMLKFDISFEYGLTPFYFSLLAIDGILLLGFLLMRFFRKPITLMIFPLFCGLMIFGLYYSRLADDYFSGYQYIVTYVVIVSAVVTLIKIFQIIKEKISFKKSIWFWLPILMVVINAIFLVNLLCNPAGTPAIFNMFDHNRSARYKIDMQKIVPQNQFPEFTVSYTESKDAQKFQFPEFRADIDQDAQWGQITIRANVEVMVMRNIDPNGRETMGNKIQLTPTTTAYYNCSCSASDCSERQRKGQTQNVNDQQCDISWRNGIYRVQLDTMGATLNKFIQMAKIVAQNSEYLK